LAAQGLAARTGLIKKVGSGADTLDWGELVMPMTDMLDLREKGPVDRASPSRPLDLLRALVRDESGATAVEYALMLGGIAAVIIATIYVFGTKTNNLYNGAASSWP
jgi:Flp pilus assembly pilin Flp